MPIVQASLTKQTNLEMTFVWTVLVTYNWQLLLYHVGIVKLLACVMIECCIILWIRFCLIYLFRSFGVFGVGVSTDCREFIGWLVSLITHEQFITAYLELVC